MVAIVVYDQSAIDVQLAAIIRSPGKNVYSPILWNLNVALQEQRAT